MEGKSRTIQSKERRAAYLFLLPWIIGFFIFYFIPILIATALGFYKYSILNPPRFVGLANFVDVFKDSLFWTSLSNSFYMVYIGVPLQILAGLSVALLLNMKVKGLAYYRAIYYLPAIVPMVASAILWLWMFNPQFGYINAALSFIGIQGPEWLGSTVWAKPAFIMMRVWAAGATMIIYLAGLKNIPVQFYEAAELDGANSFQKFLRITLPLLTPTLFFTSLTGVIFAFQIFTQAYIMTGGGPVDSTMFLVYYLYDSAFVYFKMGYACAITLILFFIILAFSLFQVKIAPLWVHYEVGRRGDKWQKK